MGRRGDGERGRGAGGRREKRRKGTERGERKRSWRETRDEEGTETREKRKRRGRGRGKGTYADISVTDMYHLLCFCPADLGEGGKSTQEQISFLGLFYCSRVSSNFSPSIALFTKSYFFLFVLALLGLH